MTQIHEFKGEQTLFIEAKADTLKQLIENTKEPYYDCLRLSSVKWHENENDYEPFVKYMLGIIVAAYRDFSSRVSLLTIDGLSKPDRNCGAESTV